MDNNKKYLFIVVVLLVIIVVKLIPSYSGPSRPSQRKLPVPTASPVITRQPAVGKGRLYLSLPSNQSPHVAAGSFLNLFINGDSGYDPVIAYDAIVAYEPVGTSSAKLRYVAAESARNDFQVFATEKNQQYLVTGAKKIIATSSAIFRNSHIATVTLVVSGKGQMYIKLDRQINKTAAAAKMMNDRVENIEGSLDGVLIEVY